MAEIERLAWSGENGGDVAGDPAGCGDAYHAKPVVDDEWRHGAVILRGAGRDDEREAAAAGARAVFHVEGCVVAVDQQEALSRRQRGDGAVCGANGVASGGHALRWRRALIA